MSITRFFRYLGPDRAKHAAQWETTLSQYAFPRLDDQFAAGSGEKAGEFYTPQWISDILSEIVTLDSQEPKTGKRAHLASVMDFACGSGSLLLNVRRRMGPHGIGKSHGQEKNITPYNLARMNMLLHGVKDSEFEISHGDTLTNDWDMLQELNPAKKPYFDAVVANPPFSYRWDPNEALGEDKAYNSVYAPHASPPKRPPSHPATGHIFERRICSPDSPRWWPAQDQPQGMRNRACVHQRVPCVALTIRRT